MWNSQICKWSLCCSRRQRYTLYTEPLVLIITSMNLEQSNWSKKWVTARVPCRDLQSFVYWSEAEGRTHSSQGTRTIHTVKKPQISPEIVSGLCRHRRGWLLRNLPTSSWMCRVHNAVRWAALRKSGGAVEFKDFYYDSCQWSWPAPLKQVFWSHFGKCGEEKNQARDVLLLLSLPVWPGGLWRLWWTHI